MRKSEVSGIFELARAIVTLKYKFERLIDRDCPTMRTFADTAAHWEFWFFSASDIELRLSYLSVSKLLVAFWAFENPTGHLFHFEATFPDTQAPVFGVPGTCRQFTSPQTEDYSCRLIRVVALEQQRVASRDCVRLGSPLPGESGYR